MSLDKKYSIGIGNTFNKLPKESIIQLGVVKLVGEIPVNNVNQAQRKRDEVFNADPNVIRCRIDTNQYDQPILDDRLLPNCYPMLPKHLNVALRGGVAMADLCKEADLEIIWRSAPRTALEKVVLDVTRLANLLPLASSDAGSIVSEWCTDQEM
jgi:hypothetical protein